MLHICDTSWLVLLKSKPTSFFPRKLKRTKINWKKNLKRTLRFKLFLEGTFSERGERCLSWGGWSSPKHPTCQQSCNWCFKVFYFWKPSLRASAMIQRTCPHTVSSCLLLSRLLWLWRKLFSLPQESTFEANQNWKFDWLNAMLIRIKWLSFWSRQFWRLLSLWFLKKKLKNNIFCLKERHFPKAHFTK